MATAARLGAPPPMRRADDAEVKQLRRQGLPSNALVDRKGDLFVYKLGGVKDWVAAALEARDAALSKTKRHGLTTDDVLPYTIRKVAVPPPGQTIATALPCHCHVIAASCRDGAQLCPCCHAGPCCYGGTSASDAARPVVVAERERRRVGVRRSRSEQASSLPPSPSSPIILHHH